MTESFSNVSGSYGNSGKIKAMRLQYLLCSKHVKSLLKAIRAHPVYFEAQLQTESKPDNFLAFSTAISYHFYISFELQLDKTKAKR